MASHDGIGVRDEQSPRRPPDVHPATPKEDRLTFYYLNYTQVPVPRSGRVEGNAHPGRASRPKYWQPWLPDKDVCRV